MLDRRDVRDAGESVCLAGQLIVMREIFNVWQER